MPIDELNVSGMMKNRHLSKAVASQKFYEFRTKPKVKCDDIKCDDNGIESGTADSFYPSYKMSHCCGSVKKIFKTFRQDISL